MFCIGSETENIGLRRLRTFSQKSLGDNFCAIKKILGRV